MIKLKKKTNSLSEETNKLKTSSKTSFDDSKIPSQSTPFGQSSLYSSLASIPITQNLSPPIHSNYKNEPKEENKMNILSSTKEAQFPMDLPLLPYHPYQFYSQGEKIGSGGFAEVYMVEHKLTHHKGAMKMIRKQNLIGAEEYLLREIEILKILSHHPNVAGLVSQDALFETNDAFFLILELCEGGELFHSIVEDGWYDESDAVHIVHQILCAVEYCHFHNVVHRDLKPENLLLKERNRARKENILMVGDFGLSNFIKMEGELLNTQCGTPAYTSPGTA
ncbi:hypothetical protein HMI54_003895 [Coelomomyces lativittatus]|nr:hypothetical protein HMI54_003895 [Coelomomyces lativittatus]